MLVAIANQVFQILDKKVDRLGPFNLNKCMFSVSASNKHSPTYCCDPSHISFLSSGSLKGFYGHSTNILCPVLSDPKAFWVVGETQEQWSFTYYSIDCSVYKNALLPLLLQCSFWKGLLKACYTVYRFIWNSSWSGPVWNVTQGYGTMFQHIGTIRNAAATFETLPWNSGAAWGKIWSFPFP